MMSQSYIPSQKDIIWVNLNPVRGTEMSKKRPCLVMTNQRFNRTTKRCLIAPISHSPKNYPTNIKLSNVYQTKGEVFLGQMRTIDFSDNGREVQFIEKVSDIDFFKVQQILHYMM